MTGIVRQRKRLLSVLAALVAVAAAVIGYGLFAGKPGPDPSPGGVPRVSQPTYRLNFIDSRDAGGTVPLQTAVRFTFDIRDEDDKVLKRFDTAGNRAPSAVIVRQDQTNFQTVELAYAPDTGVFTAKEVRLPEAGPYRLFVDFTPQGGQTDESGNPLRVVLYRDLRAGTADAYVPERLMTDQTVSSADGLDTDISLLEGDSLGVGFVAQTALNVAIGINSNGEPYKQLQLNDGSLGHLIVIGPSLEYVHVHPRIEDVNDQIGLLAFGVTFPGEGRYKLYLQTMAENRSYVFEYALSVKANPESGR